MDYLITTISNNFKIIEYIAYFSCEVLCFIGFIINLFLYLMPTKNHNKGKISNIVTCVIFSLGTIFSLGSYIVTYGFLKENAVIYSGGLFSLSSINLANKFTLCAFALLFTLITHKLTKQTKFRIPLLNAILCFIISTGCILFQLEKFILIYILIELISILIYNYASNMRIRKNGFYNLNYILLSICATILFFTFYIAHNSALDIIQINIIQVCLSMAFLLKIGIFPICNYSNNTKTRTNIPYSILSFVLYPFLGMTSFLKLSEWFNVSIEVYQITLLFFLISTIISYAIFSYKEKELCKYFSKLSYFYCSVGLIGTIFCATSIPYYKFGIMILFVTLAVFSMLSILKINLKQSSIKINSLNNLFINNKIFVLVFSILNLIIAQVIPSIFSIEYFRILKHIYSTDKIAIYFICAILFCIILIVLKNFEIIQSCYTIDKKYPKITLTKRTMLNYIVLCWIVLFLIIKGLL